MKKGIRYLRFSHEGQSNSSIEWQDLYTQQWCERTGVEIVDTFIDAGHSAKTFDRPDFDKLYKFISTYHRQVDYLVVNQMDRFSRDAGEALSMVKKLQHKYSIQICSVTEGITFDYHTPGSFFRTGLQLLLAEEDNINRAQKINSGIYTAKAKEGRWIQGGPAPFGYDKQGAGKERGLVINHDQAAVIRYIFDAYLRNTPVYIIKEKAKALGFTRKGHGNVQEIISNPIYAGYQYVKPWKDLPGGLFPAKHEAIVDMITWNKANEKLKGLPKTRVALVEEMPLRGVLHCHCSKLLTGAPSRNRKGAYYYYYKCQTSQHNNISATEAHKQLNEALGYMSLPERMAIAIRDKSSQILEDRLQSNKVLLKKKKLELVALEAKLVSVEDKWISNQMSHETYNRWYNDITHKRISVKAEIEKLSRDENEIFYLLQSELVKLTDMQEVYRGGSLLQKQELLRMVFDNSLYYKNKVYRTRYMMPIFTHNLLILKQNQLLVLDGTGAISGEVEANGFLSNHFTDFLSLVRMIRVA